MMRAETNRHDIDFGESLRWEPPPLTAEFFLWAKQTADGSAIRWKRVGGFDVLRGMPISVPEATGAIQIPDARLDMGWGDLLITFDGFDPEILQVTAHDAGARIITVDVYTLPAPTSTDPAAIAAQERRVLKDLLEMRLGLAGMVGGHVSVKTPVCCVCQFHHGPIGFPRRPDDTPGPDAGLAETAGAVATRPGRTGRSIEIHRTRCYSRDGNCSDARGRDCASSRPGPSRASRTAGGWRMPFFAMPCGGRKAAAQTSGGTR